MWQTLFGLNSEKEKKMIIIYFGKWVSKATNLFVFERIVTNKGKETPFVVMHFRHVGEYPA